MDSIEVFSIIYRGVAVLFFVVVMGYITTKGLECEDGSQAGIIHWAIVTVVTALFAAIWPVYFIYIGLTTQGLTKR